jgi:hypothetical protein
MAQAHATQGSAPASTASWNYRTNNLSLATKYCVETAKIKGSMTPGQKGIRDQKVKGSMTLV